MLCSDSALNTTNEISRQLPTASKEIPKEFKMANITINIKSSNDLPLIVNCCQNPAGNGLHLFYNSLFCYVQRVDYTCISHTHMRVHWLYIQTFGQYFNLSGRSLTLFREVKLGWNFSVTMEVIQNLLTSKKGTPKGLSGLWIRSRSWRDHILSARFQESVQGYWESK